MEIGSTHVIVFGALFIFGLFYNSLVAWLEANGHDRGYTALLVVGGVLVTIAGAAFLIGWLAALFVLASFAASGLPMVAGAWQRAAVARKADEEKARQIARSLIDQEEVPCD